MAKIHIGCAGWDYKDWIGSFYPKKLERHQHLEYYSKIFDIVEINSTFYNVPSEQTILNWANNTPESFRFIVKVWQKITHHSEDLSSQIDSFFRHIEPLNKKISAFLFQFPPWFKYSDANVHKLMEIVNNLESIEGIKYVFELRDNSWFYPKNLLKVIDGESRILGTTYKPDLDPFYLPKQKIYYIRLIGDRELTVFNRIQREQKEIIKNFEMKIKALLEIVEIDDIYIIINNHFGGFAPEMVNNMKKMLNLSLHQFNQQKKLTEFF